MKSTLPLTVLVICTSLSPVLAQVDTADPSGADGMGDIMDIYGPLTLPYTSIWFYLFMGVVLVVSLAVLLFFLFRKRKTAPAAPVPVHEQALAELDRANHYIDQDQSLRYAEKVSEILRWYLEKRFDLHSTRQTTREFFASLANLPQQQQKLLLPHHTSLQNCLEQCDLAKYAHKTTGQRSMKQLKTGVVRFIEETMAEERM